MAIRELARWAAVAGAAGLLLGCSQPEPFPPDLKALFEKAESVALYSLLADPAPAGAKVPGERLRDWPVLGMVSLPAGPLRARVVGELERAYDGSDKAVPACFFPRHALRVVHEGRTTDFVICFECVQVQVFKGADGFGRGFAVKRDAERLFDDELSKAGIDLSREFRNRRG